MNVFNPICMVLINLSFKIHAVCWLSLLLTKSVKSCCRLVVGCGFFSGNSLCYCSFFNRFSSLSVLAVILNGVQLDMAVSGIT